MSMESAFAYMERVQETRVAACDAVRMALAFGLVEPSWDEANRKLAADAFALLERCARELGLEGAPRYAMVGSANSFARFEHACLLAWIAMDAHRRAKKGTP